MSDVFPQSLLSVIQPGSYSTLDTTALAQQAAPGTRITCVIGDALGGVPNTPQTLYSEQDLKTVLRGGNLFTCARLALVGGSRPVMVVRAGSGIAQATYALAGTGGTALTITSKGWGSYVNAINVTATTTTVTITFTDTITGITYKETFTANAALVANAAIVDLANQIAGNVAGIPGSQLVTAVAGTATALTANGANGAPLAGGADNATLTGGDWTTGLKAIETVDVDFVTVSTNDATVHAQVAAHCLAMSAPAARKERRTLFGGALGESVAATVARGQSAAVATRRAKLVYPGVQLFSHLGVPTMYEASKVASYVAGRHCALPDAATSLMHKTLDDALGLEVALSTIPGGDLDTLLRANVSPIAPADGGGYWFVDDLSLEPADPYWRDFIKQGTADIVAKRLRTVTQGKSVGTKALTGTAGAIVLEARDELRQMKAEELIRDYVDGQVAVTEDPNSPSRFALVAPVMLPETTRFIGIVVALQPASTLTN